MLVVVLTALGVGLATVIGALIGFLIKKESHKLNDALLAFAGGVMLSAAIVSLIIPSYNPSDKTSIIITALGVFCGAFFISFIDRVVPHLHKLSGVDLNCGNAEKNAHLNKILLFVIAIAIHNLPEGLAAGVSFGTGNASQGMVVAGGIALQNIPEGMIIITPMLSSGITKKRTFFIALITGIIEVVGTFIGYFAVGISTVILPFMLAFAGGTMLYVISDEVIPETHAHGHERLATYMLLLGFIAMLVFDFFVG